MILKPRLTYDNDYIDKKYKEILSDFSTQGRNYFKVAHISDLHVDPTYTLDADISCVRPVCCHSYDGFPTSSSRKAKQFGAYTCNAPYKLLLTMLEYLRDVVKPDIVIWTGDTVPHNHWDHTL